MTSLFDNRIGFHCPAEKWWRAPHSGHVGMHCAHSGGGRAPFALRFLPRKKLEARVGRFLSMDRVNRASGSTRPALLLARARRLLGGSRKTFRLEPRTFCAAHRGVHCYERHSQHGHDGHRACGHRLVHWRRQMCQVRRQLCQVKLSHAVSQTSPCCEKRQFNLAHLSHSGAFVLNRILQQPAQVVAEALAILIGESRGTLGTAPSAPHFLFLMPKK